MKHFIRGAALCLVVGHGIAMAQENGAATYPDVAPIFAERCVMCHNGPAAPLGLALDSLDGVLTGSSNGPVVVAGDPAGSELIGRIKGTSQPRMPMTGPPFLSDDEIALIERWVAGGMAEGGVEAGEAPGVAQEDTPEDAQGNASGDAEKPAPAPPPAKPALPAPGDAVTYADVAPIIAQRCAKCHTESGGLMGFAPEGYILTSYESTLSAGDRVRVVPGQPDASMLVRRIRGQSFPRMPFDGPPYLSAEEIRVIEDWIAQGARDSQGQEAAVPVGAKVRLEGILGPGWRLDGLPLIVTRQTRLDKSPRPGDFVEMRGRLDRNGNIRVDRLRPR